MNEKQAILANDETEALLKKLKANPELALKVTAALAKEDNNFLPALLEHVEYAPLEDLSEKLKDFTTCEIIAEPWVGNDGHIYEEETIDKIMKEGNGLSPFTKNKLEKLVKVQSFVDIRDQFFDLHKASKKDLHQINPVFSQIKKCIPNSKRNAEISNLLQKHPSDVAKIDDAQLEVLLTVCLLSSNVAAFFILANQFKAKKEIILTFVNKPWAFEGSNYSNLLNLTIEKKDYCEAINFILDLMDEEKKVNVLKSEVRVNGLSYAFTWPNLVVYALGCGNTTFCEKMLKSDCDFTLQLLNQKVIYQKNNAAHSVVCPNIFYAYLKNDFHNNSDFYSQVDVAGNFVAQNPVLLQLCHTSTYPELYVKAVLGLQISAIEKLEELLSLSELQTSILKMQIGGYTNLIHALLATRDFSKCEAVFLRLLNILGKKFKDTLSQKWVDQTTGIHWLVATGNLAPLEKVLQNLQKDALLEIFEKGANTAANLLATIVKSASANEFLSVFSKFITPTEFSYIWLENSYAFISLFYYSDTIVLDSVLTLLGKDNAKLLATNKVEMIFDHFQKEQVDVLACAVRKGTCQNVISLALALSSEENIASIKNGQRKNIFLELFKSAEFQVIDTFLNTIGLENCQKISLDRDVLDFSLRNRKDSQDEIRKLIDKFFPLKVWLIEKMKNLLENNLGEVIKKYVEQYFEELNQFQTEDFEELLKNLPSHSFVASLNLLYLFNQNLKAVFASKLTQLWEGLPVLYFLSIKDCDWEIFFETFKSAVFALASTKLTEGNVTYENIFDWRHLSDARRILICQYLDEKQRVELLRPVLLKHSMTFLVDPQKINTTTVSALITAFPHLINDLFQECLPYLQVGLVKHSFDHSCLSKEIMSKILACPVSKPILPKNKNLPTNNLLCLAIASCTTMGELRKFLERFSNEDINKLLLYTDNGILNLFFIFGYHPAVVTLLLKYISTDELTAALYSQINNTNFLQAVVSKVSLEQLTILTDHVDKNAIKEIALQCDSQNCNVLSHAIFSKDVKKVAFVISNIFHNDLTQAIEPVTIHGNIMQFLLSFGNFETFKLVVERLKPTTVTSLLLFTKITPVIKQNPDYDKIRTFIYQNNFADFEMVLCDDTQHPLPQAAQEALVSVQTLLSNSFLTNSSQPTTPQVGGKHTLEDDEQNENKRQRRQ